MSNYLLQRKVRDSQLETVILSIDNLPLISAVTENSTAPITSGAVFSALALKQDTLVSGTNIKTINGESVLGSGNIKATSGFKQTFMYNGSEYAYCYKGLNEYLQSDDISLPNSMKIQLNGVDISFPYLVTSENTFNIVPVVRSDSLLFYGNSSFTLTANSTKTWDGTLEWSNNNGSTWSTISARSTLSGTAIYVRGTGNTHISTSSNSSPLFSITGSGISVAGNIENILDYATVALGNHPKMASRCYASMFNGCTSLVSAPSLPATTMAIYCYHRMFSGCTSLVSAPSLPATTLAENCYNHMFNGCTSLVSAPSLPATTLASNCYDHMFYGCTKIKLSTTQTGEYQNAYRIPTTGTGTTGNNSLASMFSGTGGTYTSIPSINTTYYTSNLIV